MEQLREQVGDEIAKLADEIAKQRYVIRVFLMDQKRLIREELETRGRGGCVSVVQPSMMCGSTHSYGRALSQS